MIIVNNNKRQRNPSRKNNNWTYVLPSHGSMLQASDSISEPSCWSKHVLPSLAGAGLLHFRFRIRDPPPHVAVHADHVLQSL